jgi:outer membrane protein assembly factor BamB
LGPEVQPNGVIVVVTKAGDLVELNPDGSPRAKFVLPDFNFENEENPFWGPINFFEGGITVVTTAQEIYALDEAGEQLWSFPVTLELSANLPATQASGSLLFQFDSTGMLYAYSADDGLRWQFKPENPLRDEFQTMAKDDAGDVYFADKAGTLYAFTPDGPAWQLPPPENLRAASDVVIGPDGNLYYVLTGGSAGRLVSVTPEGTVRWDTRLETPNFYKNPVFNVDGQFAVVNDDFVDAGTGQLASLDIPFEVDLLIPGEDGSDYLMSGSSIVRWQVGDAGYETLAIFHINDSGINNFTPPMVQVLEDGWIRLLYFSQNGQTLILLDQDGNTRMSRLIRYSEIQMGTPNLKATVLCEFSLDEHALNCAEYGPDSADPAWQVSFTGIDGKLTGYPFPVFYQNGRFYVVTDDQNLYVFEEKIP